jgi:cyanophycinase
MHMLVARRALSRAILSSALVAPVLGAQASGAASAPKVGPARGTVIVVGGGAMGPEVYSRFIQAAGGPNALIIDVPTAGGDSVYTQNAPGTRGWKQAGAKNIYVLHTTDRKLADSDSFAALLKKAGGVWFEGGRQWHLVDSYADTKTEQAFHDVLARGGVVGGSSAGASILASYLVRGARENNFIIDAPAYPKGFGFLRGVGIDQHVVARERLRDLADSTIPRHPELLGMSEDEGTAWVVRGDTAEIIGRNKAFAYNGKTTDPGKPFLTLYPGDRYNLATRTVIHRAADESPVSQRYVDSLVAPLLATGHDSVTVLVAQAGKVFIDRSYGIADQPNYMPTTTVPQFNLGQMSSIVTALCSQLPTQAAPPTNDSARAGAAARGGRGGRGGPPQTPLQSCVARRISTPIGWHKTTANADGQILSDVDELYRLELGLQVPTAFTRDTTSASSGGHALDYTSGWRAEPYHGVNRLVAYAEPNGKRGAFVRIPDRRAAIIILTNDPNADVASIADRITDRLLTGKARR